MTKTIYIFFILILISNAFSSQSSNVISIDEMVKIALQAKDFGQFQTCPNSNTNNIFQSQNLARDSFIPLKKNDYCSPFNSKIFCKQVSEVCQIKTLHKKCLPLDQKSRFADPQARIEAFEAAKAIFDKTKAEKSFSEMCCGPKGETCREKLLQTKFEVVADQNSNNQLGRYLPETHTIQFAEGILLRQTSLQQLEYIITHELGHACQFSKHKNGEKLLQISEFRIMEENSLRDIESIFGPETKNCIENAVKKEAEIFRKAGGKIQSLGSWYRETFADLMAATKMTRYLHWQVACNTSSDDMHPGLPSYMHCLMNRFPLKNRFCPTLNK